MASSTSCSSSSTPLELILLGTGTSSCLPSIGCLTDPIKGCFACRSTLDLFKFPEAKRNMRRCTSALLRIPAAEKEGRSKTLLIDCGKSFLAGALEHFPRKGLREIDAVLLTHPHSDATLGLDDLRGWTLQKNIQESISIYANQFTYDEVSRSFPYLTDVSKATGGGDVPQFVWHIFDDTKPFEILGVRVVPLRVHHGLVFSTPPSPYYSLGFLFNSRICYISDVSHIPEEIWTLLEEECELPVREGKLVCHNRKVLTTSNGNITPLDSNSDEEDSTVSKTLHQLTLNGLSGGGRSKRLHPDSPPPTPTLSPPPSATSFSRPVTLINTHNDEGTSANRSVEGQKNKPKLEVLILDCLRLENHRSHFGIGQAVSTARRMGVSRTYLVGFSHRPSHSLWVQSLSLLSSPSTSLPTTRAPFPINPSNRALKNSLDKPWEFLSGTPIDGTEDLGVWSEHLLRVVDNWSRGERLDLTGVEEREGGERGVWIRPGVDGGSVWIGEKGVQLRDDMYDC